MLLLHSRAFGAMRAELIQNLGFEHAQRLLLGMGCASGTADAAMVRELEGDMDPEAAFMSGPKLHTLEGIVRVEPLKLEINRDRKHFYGEFKWINSYEAEEHIRTLGMHTGPVCWTQIGYACGFTSEFMETPILFKEVECVAQGGSCCRIIGKPVDEWGDDPGMASYQKTESIAELLYNLQDEVSELRSRLTAQLSSESIVAESESMKETLRLLETAAGVDVTVLMLGETGVGKEVFSRLLHDLSNRGDKDFVAVNCAALPGELVEAELFGVEKGAYTGAESSRPGRFERAHGGTLFLDELAELPVSAQSKLLRVLQTGEFDRVGDTRTRRVDVRLIAATNVDLHQAVREGRFRADLLYRLNIFPITIPPLRERRNDLEGLVKKFVHRFSVKYSKKIQGVTEDVLQWMQGYSWPGNIRELENVIERGVLLTPSGELVNSTNMLLEAGARAESVGADESGSQGAVDAESAGLEVLLDRGTSFDELEVRLLRMAVKRSKGNVAEAARMLNMGDAQLRYRLKKHGIELKECID